MALRFFSPNPVEKQPLVNPLAGYLTHATSPEHILSDCIYVVIVSST